MMLPLSLSATLFWVGWAFLALGLGCHIVGAVLHEHQKAAAFQAWLDGSPEEQAFRAGERGSPYFARKDSGSAARRSALARKGGG